MEPPFGSVDTEQEENHTELSNQTWLLQVTLYVTFDLFSCPSIDMLQVCSLVDKQAHLYIPLGSC